MTEEKKKINVFVTYAWSGKIYNEQVISLTNHLRNAGYNAINDTFLTQSESSIDLTQMMNEHLTNAQKVIIIISEHYKKKADKFEGGVGEEYRFILKDIQRNKNKYIIAAFEKYDEKLFPAGLLTREMVSLADRDNLEDLYRKLNDTPKYAFSSVADTNPEFLTQQIPAFATIARPKLNPDVTNISPQDDDIPIDWNVQEARTDFYSSIGEQSLLKIKEVLQFNSFFFYDIYERKQGALPIFFDVPIGKDTIDFAWLNDASSGPEWVLIRVAMPYANLSEASGEMASALLSDIERVKNWQRYFAQHPQVKDELFGAVAKFRYHLIVGTADAWQTEIARDWRMHHNNESNIEIRSYNTFENSLRTLEQSPRSLYRFNHYPQAADADQLRKFWSSYEWMQQWIKPKS